MNDNRYILVIADDSPEMEIALEYACARSKKTSRKIIIATFIEPLDVLTTQGVTEIMKNEARDEAEKSSGKHFFVQTYFYQRSQFLTST